MKRAALSTFIVVSVLLLLAPAQSCKKNVPPTDRTPFPEPVVEEKELMITSLSVVEDDRATSAGGPWSFGHLVAAMAGDNEPGEFVKRWLMTWETAQPINGDNVEPRKKIRDLVINPWKAKDHPENPSVPDGQWKVHFANAPFRLLAIVNRIDLNRIEPPQPNVPPSGGEGRFVFGVLAPDPEAPTALRPLPFTVIFEYELIATDREALRGWARDWHALGRLPFGAQYNEALQKITDRFSGKQSAPGKPNGNALNQLRTNEIALVRPDFALGWELREFTIDPQGGFLRPDTVKQTPANEHNNQPILADFVNANATALANKTARIPLEFNGTKFMGGSAIVAPPVPNSRNFVWNAPGIQNNDARHGLGFLACNGCHQAETKTDTFLHVANREAGEPAKLSGFLTGTSAPDPARPEESRFFGDLGARKEILEALLREPDATRIRALTTPRIGRVH